MSPHEHARRTDNDAHGAEARGVAATPEDVQAELEQAARFAGKLAHDFGNLLTGILGFAELARDQVPADSPLRSLVAEVLQSAKQGAAWLSKLQMFCRRTASPAASCRLAQVLAAEQERRLTAWPANVALRFNVAAELPATAVDASAAAEALRQVLDNAAEAVAGGGETTVSASEVELDERQAAALVGAPAPGRFVELAVGDTGPGLPEPLRQGKLVSMMSASRKRLRGLGLAAVYGLLRACGGGMELGSTPEGGALVRLYFPVVPERRGPAADAASAASPRSVRILLVDDDPDVLEVAGRILQEAGYATRAALGPREALACFGSAGDMIHLVVTDVTMPGMSGLELASLLCAAEPRLPILLMSGDPGFVPPAPRWPMLRKPFAPVDLLLAVRQSLTAVFPRISS